MGLAKLNWTAVLLIIVISETPDFLLPTSQLDLMPFWVMYSLNTFIDLTAALLLFTCIKQYNLTPRYAEIIGWLFIASVSLHFVFWLNEWMIRYYPYDIFDHFNRFFYSPSLKVILLLKGLALFWGGHGIYRVRKRARHHGRGDHVPSPAVIYSRDYVGYRRPEEQQSSED